MAARQENAARHQGAAREQAENGRSRLRRSLEAAIAVGVVVALGLVLDMGMAAYVAISFPAAVIFQLWVRRRPLQEMWVRNGPALSRASIIPWLIPLLAIAPVIALATGAVDSAGQVIWFLVVIAGVVPASYVIAQRGPETLRQVFLCLATGGLVGTVLLLGGAIAEVDDLVKRKLGFLEIAEDDALLLVEQFLILWPGYYVVEEVLFRGVLDSHVHHQGERHWLASALLVSFLWGCWHLPVVVGQDASAGATVANALILQMAVGPFLSYWWRRSGNLLVPAVTHDWLDSFRNAFAGGP